MFNLEYSWQKKQTLLEPALKTYLKEKSSLVSQAMRYAIFSGGKRLRPFLLLSAVEICNGKIKEALPFACSLELIHTYSLIHDDLPALDNDDYRRNKPSVHKKFNQATAILAGDALLTKAFELIVSGTKEKNNSVLLIPIIKELTFACGVKGMIGGQEEDLILNPQRQISRKQLENIYQKKTADLITVSLKIGALSAGAKKEEIKALEKYGKNIGLAFQLSDDLLDYQREKKLKKITYPQLYGIEETKRRISGLVKKAKRKLSIFGKKAKILEEFADFIQERKK